MKTLLPDCRASSLESGPHVSVAGQSKLCHSRPSFRNLLGLEGISLGTTLDIVFFRSVAASLISNLALQAGTIFNVLIAARLLGKELYGQLAIIQTTLAAVAALGSMGLGITATKYMSQYRSTDPNKAGRVLTLIAFISAVIGSAATLVVLILAHRIVNSTLGAGHLAGMLRLSAPYILFAVLNGFQIGALTGFQAFARLARMTSAGTILSVLVGYMLIRHWGLSGAAAMLSFQSCIMFFFCHLALRSECRASEIRTGAGGFWNERCCLFDFSLPAAAAGLLGSFAIWYCSAILVRERGFGEMAVFSVASTFRSLVMFTPTTIGRVTTPLINVQLAHGSLSRYRQAYRTNIVLLGGSALLAAVPFMLAKDFFLRAFGKGFVDSSGAVPLLLLATVVEAIIGGVQQAFFAHGRFWLQLVGILTWSTALVVFTYTLAWRGAAGLALAYLGSWLICGLFSLPVAARLNARTVSKHDVHFIDQWQQR